MSEQPTALRLADALEISSNHGMRREAAAELRRLAAVEAQRDAMQERAEYWKRKHDDEETGAERYALRVQRDELLEALRKHVELHDGDCICEDCAAIAKAKEQQ